MALRKPSSAAVGRLAAALAAVWLGALGCSSSRFGSELSARPKPRAIDQADGTTLRLPEAEKFSIALPEHSEKPGLDGTADADAHVFAAGAADASAAITNSGAAEGSFQLGHALANQTERQTDFDFTVSCHYVFEAGATPESGFPDAQVGLKIYARDGRGRLLRDLTVMLCSTDSGGGSGESDVQRQFGLTLAPGEIINVFLAGQTKVEIREGRSAHGSLKLTDVHMTVVTRPAPPVAAGHD